MYGCIISSSFIHILMEALSSFAFEVIIDRYVVIAILLFSVLVVLFLFFYSFATIEHLLYVFRSFVIFFYDLPFHNFCSVFSY